MSICLLITYTRKVELNNPNANLINQPNHKSFTLENNSSNNADISNSIFKANFK